MKKQFGMDKRFIIIHPHDLIRRGLWAILREAFHFEFILLNSVDALKDYSGLKNLQLILIIADEYNEPQSIQWIHLLLGTNNLVHQFTLQYSSVCCSNFEQTILIEEPAQKIIEKIKKLFEKQKTNLKIQSELSEREKDVLAQVALGFTNKEIADKLFISIHTVISHRKNITDKLGIKSISGLTVYAILNKLIDTENIDPATLI